MVFQKTTILLACLVALVTAAAASDPYQIPRIEGKITVDAVLDEAAWQHALVLELDVEVQPGENIDPPVRTEVLLCYGENHFYAAFRAFDPDPSAIRARYSDRDRLWEDDGVALVLDTFDDARRSFNFYVNPLGIQADLIETTSGNGGPQWDAIWDSAGRIVDDGYIVEIAIPFSSLRFQPSEGDQVWGIDAVRSYPRNVTHIMGLFPRDRSNNCYLCQAEHIQGFAGADPGRNMEFAPTISAIHSEEREPFPDGPFEEVDSSVEAGLTARWGVTPNLNLSATINPDFSQIEADAAQLDINTQFSLFYPEKRPFFLEGFDYFQTPINAIYTRTLADPIWGVKASGKVGRGAIGFFSVRDDMTNLLFPGSEGSTSTSLASQSTGTVLRYRHDIGESSTVGGLITNREGAGGYHNRLYGGDIDLRLTPTDLVRFQLLGSETRYPLDIAQNHGQPEDQFSGHAIDFLYIHQTRTFEIYGKYQEISPGFRADLGFVPQAGFAFYDTGYLHTWQQDDPDHWYNKIKVWLGYERTEDADGSMLRSTPGTFIEYKGPLQSSFFSIIYFGKQTYLGMEYDDRTVNAAFDIVPAPDIKLGLRVLAGDQIDYLHARPGTRLRLTPSIEFFAGRHLNLDFSHIYEEFDVDIGRLYTANLSELRTVYQFNRRAFVRLILQYADYDFNVENYAAPRDPEFKHLLTQLLFTYKVNPQTALYLGYSDNHRGDSRIDLTQLNRTAFFKIGYAWVP
ncbi:MAG: DUF5916 domain-containing protein [Acidobacteriota bacterium]